MPPKKKNNTKQNASKVPNKTKLKNYDDTNKENRNSQAASNDKNLNNSDSEKSDDENMETAETAGIALYVKKKIEAIRRLFEKGKVKEEDAFDLKIEDFRDLEWFNNLRNDESWKGLTTVTRNNRDITIKRAQDIIKQLEQLANDFGQENNANNNNRDRQNGKPTNKRKMSKDKTVNCENTTVKQLSRTAKQNDKMQIKMAKRPRR